MLKIRMLKMLEVALIFSMLVAPEVTLVKENFGLKLFSWAVVLYCIFHTRLVRHYIDRIEAVQGSWVRLIVALICMLLPFGLLVVLQTVVGAKTPVRYMEIVLYTFLYFAQVVILFTPASSNPKAPSS